MVGMLASRFVLGGRSPQCTGSSTAFTRCWLSPLRCCTRKSGISACYSQHPSCWQYVGAAVDCKNIVLFQLRSITSAVYCWAVNDTYVISSLAFKVSLKKKREKKIIPPLTVLTLLIYRPSLHCKKIVHQNKWVLYMATPWNDTIVCLCSAEGKCWIFL